MSIETSNSTNAKWLPYLLLIALGLALATVVLSSYVRLAESGVGCEPWPSCYGQYNISEAAQGVNVLTSQGATSSYRLERVAHRLVTTSLGLIILTLFVFSRSGKYSQLLGKKLPLSLLIVTIVLSALGPFHPNQPLPILLMSNFVGGLLLVVMIYHLYRRITPVHEIHMITPLIPFLRIGLLIILLQIVWGGWTSSNFAGASCDNLFSCGISEQEDLNVIQAFNPIDSLQLENGNKVILESKMNLIQLLHHVLGVIAVVYFVLIVVMLMRSERGSDRRLAKDCLLVLSLIIGQFLLGISSLLLDLPMTLVLSHNFLTAILLIFISSLNIKISRRTDR